MRIVYFLIQLNAHSNSYKTALIQECVLHGQYVCCVMNIGTVSLITKYSELNSRNSETRKSVNSRIRKIIFFIISLNGNSQIRAKPRNSEVKRIPPIFPLLWEFTVPRNTFAEIKNFAKCYVVLQNSSKKFTSFVIFDSIFGRIQIDLLCILKASIGRQ